MSCVGSNFWDKCLDSSHMIGPPEARVGAILVPQVVELTGASSADRIFSLFMEEM